MKTNLDTARRYRASVTLTADQRIDAMTQILRAMDKLVDHEIANGSPQTLRDMQVLRSRLVNQFGG